MTTATQISWRTVPLGECCDIISGSTPRRDTDEYWNGDIAWVTPKDLSDLPGPVFDEPVEFITEAGFKSCSTQMLPKGAILFSSRAPIGLVAIAGLPLCTNQGFKSLVPRDGVESRYLYYCMKRLVPLVQSLGNGATFKEVSRAVMERVEIPLPPLSEQKRIADILDKADAIRRKRQEAEEHTKDLLAAAFTNLFGDPVLNPNEFQEATLDEVAHLQSGVTKGRKLEDKETIDVPYMRVWNVQDGHLRLGDIKDITVLPSDVEKYQLEDGDLLLTEGGDPDQLGRGAIWYSPIPLCIHQNHIFRVRSDQSVVVPEFLSALIGSQRGKRYFLKMAKQTTGIASVNMTQLRKCPVFLPPLKLQQKYADIDRKFEQTNEGLSARFDVVDDLFNSLVQRAFKGQL